MTHKASLLLLLLTIWMTCSISFSSAQVIKPVSWYYESSAQTFEADDTVALHFWANIDSGWYMYASDFSKELGPVPTNFDFRPHTSYELLDEVQSVGSKEKYDSLWQGTYTYFQDKAHFQQNIRIRSSQPQLHILLTYQVCSDQTGQCIQLEEEISTHSFLKESAATSDANLWVSDVAALWKFFLIAFLSGLAALLTPCVFPLIPMTVTYFIENKGTNKNATLYGGCIVLIYTLIGFGLSPFMGPAVANELATGWIPNVVFFLVFLFFGLSFLGLFDIVLPYKWANFTEHRTEKGGLGGIFFMALTLVLITFSCTGPIVGSILVESAGGIQLKPVVGMLGYSLAFALPFSLFARFPSALSALPKSGGWLNTVKVTLGFLELAFALKFLSIPDQAYHWGILDREVYLSLWIAIFGLLVLYLLGIFRLSKDTAERITVPRLLCAWIVLSFVVYLIPGLFGAPLKALSGYLPPKSTQDFDLSTSMYPSSPPSAIYALCEEPMYADFLHLPHNLQGYFDLTQALACAKKQQKPVFVDFTGHGCVNCREMEARVWADPRVLQRLQKNFIIAALYIDEKTLLPKEKWYTSTYDGKQKKSIGQQHADMQITSFQNNAQPYYVILSPKEGELLVAPRAYSLDIEAFISFLDSGTEAARTSITPKT